jgi:hypothetical protein
MRQLGNCFRGFAAPGHYKGTNAVNSCEFAREF